MKSTKSRRKFSNIKYTRKYHFRYMGMWILIVVGAVLCLNSALYLYFQEYCRRMAFSSPESYFALRRAFIAALALEGTIIVAAIVVLAIMTSHRIAGAFIRLRNAFDDVRNGNLEHRLKFRAYDGLEELEDSFNAMMEEIGRRVDGAQGGPTGAALGETKGLDLPQG